MQARVRTQREEVACLRSGCAVGRRPVCEGVASRQVQCSSLLPRSNCSITARKPGEKLGKELTSASQQGKFSRVQSGNRVLSMLSRNYSGTCAILQTVRSPFSRGEPRFGGAGGAVEAPSRPVAGNTLALFQVCCPFFSPWACSPLV